MANDSKTKTRDDLLGELESIKTLLDEKDSDIIDFGESDDIDPPTLTGAFDEVSEEDIPILTESLEAPTNAATIESLEAEVLQNELEHWPEELSAESSLPEANAEEIVDLTADEPEGSAESLFADLESEFKQQLDEHEASESTSAVLQSEINSDLTDDESLFEEIASNEELENELIATEAVELTEDFELAHEVDGVVQSDSNASDITGTDIPKTKSPDTENNEASTTTADLTNTKSEPVAPVVGDKAHSQQSLFDPPNSKQSAATTTAKEKPTKPTIEKTENPFLPKHIRDRLHTKRSLQDEIMESPLFSNLAKSTAANSPSSPNTSSNAPTNTVSHSQTPSISASKEEAIIDDLVNAFLPKIEQLLRQRLRDVVNETAETQSDSDSEK